jgi:hypothetical protein
MLPCAQFVTLRLNGVPPLVPAAAPVPAPATAAEAVVVVAAVAVVGRVTQRRHDTKSVLNERATGSTSATEPTIADRTRCTFPVLDWSKNWGTAKSTSLCRSGTWTHRSGAAPGSFCFRSEFVASTAPVTASCARRCHCRCSHGGVCGTGGSSVGAVAPGRREHEERARMGEPEVPLVMSIRPSAVHSVVML